MLVGNKEAGRCGLELRRKADGVGIKEGWGCGVELRREAGVWQN